MLRSLFSAKELLVVTLVVYRLQSKAYIVLQIRTARIWSTCQRVERHMAHKIPRGV